MAKSYFYDESIADWRELVKGEQGERGPQGEQGPVGPEGPQGPMGSVELVGDPSITVDTSVGTRVFVGDTKIYDEATQPAFSHYVPTAEDGVLFNAMRVQVLSFGDVKMVTIAGGYRHETEMQHLFSVYPEHRPRTTVMTWNNGGSLCQLLGDGRFRGTSARTQPGWAYINISYITDRT